MRHKYIQKEGVDGGCGLTEVVMRHGGISDGRLALHLDTEEHSDLKQDQVSRGSVWLDLYAAGSAIAATASCRAFLLTQESLVITDKSDQWFGDVSVKQGNCIEIWSLSMLWPAIVELPYFDKKKITCEYSAVGCL